MSATSGSDCHDIPFLEPLMVSVELTPKRNKMAGEEVPLDTLDARSCPMYSLGHVASSPVEPC